MARKRELSVQEILDEVGTEFKNASAHIGKMVRAGLIMKRHEGVLVRHALTNRGEKRSKIL